MKPDVVLLAVINQRYSNQCASQIALKGLVTLGVMQLLGEKNSNFCCIEVKCDRHICMKSCVKYLANDKQQERLLQPG